MTTVTSGIDEWMNAFADALGDRAGLAGVLVTTGQVLDIGKQDSIQLTDVEGTQTWGLLGNRRRDEEFRVSAIISVLKAGKGDPVIRAARARAVELLAEVEDELRVRTTVGATARWSALTSYDLNQFATTDGRVCEISFEVSSTKFLAS